MDYKSNERRMRDRADHDYAEWVKEIPYITLPKGYEMRAIPAFGGAVVRYNVKRGNKSVSIYLDCYDALGYMGKPYWELYPHEGDIYRCLMQDVESLRKAIIKALR